MVARNRFTATGLWLPLVCPLVVQIGSAVAASALWKHRDTRREREHLSTALAHYLPPKIAEQLAREIGDVRAADQLVFGTCLSTDAHQYTTLSETMEPAELGALMNRYYGVLFEPVKRHGGLVQDVVGDSMLADLGDHRAGRSPCGAARVSPRWTSPRPWTASTRRRAGSRSRRASASTRAGCSWEASARSITTSTGRSATS